MKKREWEDITDTKYAVIVRRLRVPWGWLVMTVDDVMHKNHDGVLVWSGYDWRTSVAFIFDPFHWWKP